MASYAFGSGLASYTLPEVDSTLRRLGCLHTIDDLCTLEGIRGFGVMGLGKVGTILGA